MVELPQLPSLAARSDAGIMELVRPWGVLAVAVAPGDNLESISQATGFDLAALVAEHSIGPAGSSQVMTLPVLLEPGPLRRGPRVLALVGIGNGTAAELRGAGLAMARAATAKPHLAVALGRDLDPLQSQALAEGLLLASYRMPRVSSRPSSGEPCPEIVVSGGLHAVALRHAEAAVWGTFLARTLAATPSNTKNPHWLAEQAAELVALSGDSRLTVTVRDERWLADNGFGALLAVGRGSATPPRLVTVSWAPGAGPAVALVGKGITFDTGGLSLKPREPMVPMKTDMAGAATVLATVLAAARLQLPVPVLAVLALAENSIGAAAMRPGDVVRTLDGTTVEVLNTDAEGRLVLADALAWARRELSPRVLLDVATLTGAATLGLGRHYAALYASDDALAQRLTDCGAAAGEGLWHMPLVADYRRSLESPVADLANIANNDHVKAGSVIAALFLAHFAGDTRWAHLDIAGTGRTGSKTAELPANAPTGFAVRTLLRWLAAGAEDGGL